MASRSPTRVPPPGLLKTVRPSPGVARAGRPVQVDHQVGHRGRRQQRLVPPGRQLEPPLLPGQALRQPGVERRDVHVGEVPGGGPRPRRPCQVGRLRVELQPPLRLVVAHPQARRRAQEGGGHPVLGEPVQLAPGALGRPQRLPEFLGEGPEYSEFGGCCRISKPTFIFRTAVAVSADQIARVLGGRGLGGGLLGLPHDVFDLIRPDPGPGDDADPRRAARAPVDRDHGEAARGGDPVGGERVARPAQVRGRVLVGDHDAFPARSRPRPGLGRGKRALDGLLGRVRHHALPSSAVLSTRTWRKSAAGAPWLTGATWPGWPLPQLNAPPST